MQPKPSFVKSIVDRAIMVVVQYGKKSFAIRNRGRCKHKDEHVIPDGYITLQSPGKSRRISKLPSTTPLVWYDDKPLVSEAIRSVAHN
jgi:hypothetical protein